MRGLMPNPLTKLSESTEEDEVLRSRKRKLDMEAESDSEQLREQLRLHLEDKRILNGDAGKRLRRDFGRLLKSGEEGVPMADIDYEIYINESFAVIPAGKATAPPSSLISSSPFIR